MTFSVEPHTIFVTLAGSQAHGTAREGSDIDLRGVCIAPPEVRLSLFSSFEQYEGPLGGELETAVRRGLEAHASASHRSATKIECVVFDVAKFMGLCAGANPNALEILFSDPADWLFEAPPWRRLYDQRRRFLTRKVRQTFLGYALAQLKKIKTHRSWLLHPPARPPSRIDFGDDEVEDRLRAVATHALNVPPDVTAALNAEKKYRAAVKHWDSYQTWLTQRNRARADLERQHGYDTKHAMHLVRLMRMGLEALEHGDLLVRRPDADELAAIRDGALSFDELLGLAARLQVQMERAAGSTSLAEDIDAQAVDQLALSLITGSVP